MPDELAAVPDVVLPDAAASGVILLGLMKGRAHAAHFSPEDAAPARKAATLMGLHVLPIGDEPAIRELAAQLAKGRIFRSGSGFVPFCRAAIYRQLCGLGGIDPTVTLERAEPPVPPEIAEALHALSLPVRLPTSWDDVGPGSLVLATEEDQAWCRVTVIKLVERGFRLAWVDCDPLDYPPITRPLDQLALLPSGYDREPEPEMAA